MTSLASNPSQQAAADPGAILAATGHRQSTPPPRPWVMYQRWSDLLFMHWPVPREQLIERIPPGLALDLHADQSWIGVTPFEVQALRVRGLPALPGVSTFPEVNVRTYVQAHGKPGVFFFSLDAGSRLAVHAARLTYALPYLHASMKIERRGRRVMYESRRTDRRAGPALLSVEYEPIGPITPAPVGSLAHWLTERYRLYTVRRRRVYEAEIHHRQWPLQEATSSLAVNTMHGDITLLAASPLLHFSRRLDVLIWTPKRIG